MNKEITDWINQMKKSINPLAELSLLIDSSWEIWEQVYSKEDLANVSLIFMHILWNISAAHLLKEKWIDLWLEIFESEIIKLKDIIFNITWIDTHKLFD